MTGLVKLSAGVWSRQLMIEPRRIAIIGSMVATQREVRNLSWTNVIQRAVILTFVFKKSSIGLDLNALLTATASTQKAHVNHKKKLRLAKRESPANKLFASSLESTKFVVVKTKFMVRLDVISQSHCQSETHVTHSIFHCQLRSEILAMFLTCHCPYQ